jgi:hypothetical protein
VFELLDVVTDNCYGRLSALLAPERKYWFGLEF